MHEDKKMTGWKSKFGGVLLAIGGGCLAVAQLSGFYPKVAFWMQVAGAFMTTVGGSLLGVGIAHKIEKAK
jgi:hypothetical protein